MVFFGYDTGGKLKQISQSAATLSGDETNISASDRIDQLAITPRPWMDQPKMIDDGHFTGPKHAGLLHFWTSTARLSIRRQRNSHEIPEISHSIPELDIDCNCQLFMDAWSHVQKMGDQNTEQSAPENLNLDEYEILEREFVIISSLERFENNADVAKNRADLAALVVEWKDGVAYRIGMCLIQEHGWMSLKKRVWKRVTLG